MSWNGEKAKDDEEKARDVLERVTLAIRALCIGKKDVISRLKHAIKDHIIELRKQDFPAALQDTFEGIMESVTRYDASDLDKSIPLRGGLSHNQFEDRVHSTMRRIQRKTGQKIACDIWDLYMALRQISGEQIT